MGYKQNNPLPMMKSALKMEKEMRKSGMHRNSAMYMGHESPAEMGHSPMEMGHSPMEMGHESPAKKYDSPAMESRELKDMPIVDIEKGKAKGSPAKMGHDKNDDSPANHYFDPMHKQHKDDHKKKGSPAKAAKPDYIDIDGDGNKEESMKQAAKDKKGSPAKKYDRVVLGGNKGDKSKTKPGKKDYEGKGSPAKFDKMSKKQAKDHARALRTAEGKATKKDERKNKRDSKRTQRHIKKHGSGLIMD